LRIILKLTSGGAIALDGGGGRLGLGGNFGVELSSSKSSYRTYTQQNIHINDTKKYDKSAKNCVLSNF
jgi:hypothetical protein